VPGEAIDAVHGDQRVDAKIDAIELAANGLTFSAD